MRLTWDGTIVARFSRGKNTTTSCRTICLHDVYMRTLYLLLLRIQYRVSERTGGPVKIVDAKAIVCCPGRNFVTLKIATEDGIYGLGDATLNGRELAVASYLADHLVPLLIGRDARRIEDTWQYLYKGAYWRRGPVTMSAIAAVDTALWDIKAKSLNAPLFQLLGAPSRAPPLAYSHAS